MLSCHFGVLCSPERANPWVGCMRGLCQWAEQAERHLVKGQARGTVTASVSLPPWGKHQRASRAWAV